MKDLWTNSVFTNDDENDGEERAREIEFQVVDVFGDQLAKAAGVGEVRKAEASITVGEDVVIDVRVVPLGIPVSGPRVPFFLIQLIALDPQARVYIDQYYAMLLSQIEYYAGTQGRPYRSVVGRVSLDY